MSTLNQETAKASQTTRNLPLQGIEYVELYVGNVTQATHYYRTAFGFTPVAYAGLETGLRDCTSAIVQQGTCTLLLTAPLATQGPIADYLRQHGDGVKDIALRVENTEQAFHEAISLGARSIQEPTVIEDHGGQIIKATVGAYGDVAHSFIQREGPHECFLPGYHVHPQRPGGQEEHNPSTGLHAIDHFAISLPPGELERWVQFYIRVFGFHPIHEEGIATEYSAMQSIALEDDSERIKFVLIEPIPGKRRSQIEEFLTFHQGPGVQHIALHTQDIIRTIDELEARGVGFVSAPDSYFEMLPERVGEIAEDIAALRRVNVLVDRDEWGYLLQIFSLPTQHRPTLFIEVIQRKAARGFGSGNIQALFKALEREQARRGNL